MSGQNVASSLVCWSQLWLKVWVGRRDFSHFKLDHGILKFGNVFGLVWWRHVDQILDAENHLSPVKSDRTTTAQDSDFTFATLSEDQMVIWSNLADESGLMFMLSFVVYYLWQKKLILPIFVKFWLFTNYFNCFSYLQISHLVVYYYR